MQRQIENKPRTICGNENKKKTQTEIHSTEDVYFQISHTYHDWISSIFYIPLNIIHIHSCNEMRSYAYGSTFVHIRSEQRNRNMCTCAQPSYMGSHVNNEFVATHKHNEMTEKEKTR